MKKAFRYLLPLLLLMLLTLPALLGPEGIYFAEPAAWTGAAILLVVSYFHRERALEKEFQSKKEVSP